uniref:Holocytochrome c-type synthase n=1 Tax=Hirondellea gigas TaxID=1518452 RepID=A0A6A7GAV6_9CRUS
MSDTEPPNSKERPIQTFGSHAYPIEQKDGHTVLDEEFEEVPIEHIPSTGRGNSSDGKTWLNPSAGQLYRSCHRKNKGLEVDDAPAMSSTHVAITEGTWNAILEYENLHKSSCPEVKLARFWGMFEQHTIKARLIHSLGNDYPFDRHDWVVDRCGKEVRYIIDYYSTQKNGSTDDDDLEFFIDARPAPNFFGLVDRAHLAFNKWRAGESWW